MPFAQVVVLAISLVIQRRALLTGPPLTMLDWVTVAAPLLMIRSGELPWPAMAIQLLGWGICLAGLWRLQPNQLATVGVYRLVRHPMYSGYLLWLAGWTVTGPYPWFNALVWLWLCWGLTFRLAREEAWLSTHQPEAYAEYRQKVRYKLVPPCY